MKSNEPPVHLLGIDVIAVPGSTLRMLQMQMQGTRDPRQNEPKWHSPVLLLDHQQLRQLIHYLESVERSLSETPPALQ